MGEHWKAIKEVFLRFWCNNIKKNYKAISGAFAVFITTTLGIVFMNIAGNVSPELSGIFYALDILMTFLTFKIMGKATNGNGYGKPETKALIEIMKKDEEFRKLAMEKVKKYVENSKSLNGI